MRLFLFIVSITIFAGSCVGQISDDRPKFLNKLDFGIDSVLDWRIYYSRGNTEIGDNKNPEVFAVSGDKQKLSDLGISSSLSDVFNDLRTARIVKKKFQNGTTIYNGNPETISFRWKCTAPDKGLMGVDKWYRISVILREDKNKTESLKDFVEVSVSVYANEPTVYLLKKDDVKKLVKIFTQFAQKDWGNNYEKNP